MASSVGPTPPRTPGASSWNLQSNSQSNSASRSKANARTTQEDATASTQNAQDQISRNQKAVEDSQRETDINLEHIREGYDQSSMAESSTQEDALAKQKLKGYEQLRDLKRQQELEYNRVHRDGEKQLKDTQDYYRDTLYVDSRKGDQELQDMKAKQGREMEFVQTTGQSDVTLQKGEQTRKVEDLKRNQEEQFNQLNSSSRAEYERMKTNTVLAQQQEHDKFGADYKSIMDTDQHVIDDLRTKAGTQIKQIRQDTAQKLAAYSSRQSDPFYKMVDMNAELSDEGDRYVLRANIPSHEQEHVTVALKGNSLVLSGNRRNEEKLDLSPGKFKGTSSFQSFQESFPLAQPVDRNALSKEYRGDQVIVTIPKSTQTAYHEAFQVKAQPARVRAERPHFPGNLPGVSEETEAASNEKSGRSDKDKAGRTLT